MTILEVTISQIHSMRPKNLLVARASDSQIAVTPEACLCRSGGDGRDCRGEGIEQARAQVALVYGGGGAVGKAPVAVVEDQAGQRGDCVLCDRPDAAGNRPGSDGVGRARLH